MSAFLLTAWCLLLVPTQAAQDEVILARADQLLEEAKSAYSTARSSNSITSYVDASFKLEEARIKYIVLLEIGQGDRQKIASDRLRIVNQLSKLIHDGKTAISGMAVTNTPENPPTAKAPESPPAAPIKAMDLSKRAAVPDAAKQKEAEKLIKDLFKEQYSRKAPEDRTALVRLLLDQASKSQEDPAAYWVLCREASDVAAQNGEIRAALDSIDAAAKLIDIDAMALRNAALTTAGRNVKSPDDFAELTDALAALTEEYVRADQYDPAEKAIVAAAQHSKKANDPPMMARVATRAKEISEAKTLFAGMKTVLDVLARTPDDPAANAEMGRYLCYVKGTWDLGLRFMAKGADPALKALAEKETFSTAPVADRVALADSWYDLAEREKSPLRKNQMQAHAKALYQALLVDTQALVRARLEKRLDGLQNVGNPPGQTLRSAIVNLTYLSAKKVEVGWDQLWVNSNKDNASVWVSGKECRQYLFPHPPSTLVYDIPAGCKAFVAVGARLDRNHKETVGSFRYIVAVDGKVLYTSPALMQAPGLEIPIAVAVPAGARELQLKIDPLADQFNDWAIWAYPRLLK